MNSCLRENEKISIYTNWTKYFTMVDIIDALAANQDIIVMKND